MSEPAAVAPAADPARLDALFFALSDARRRAMIERLSDGEHSVKDLAGPLDLALPSAVKHLAVLENADIVRSAKSGRVRTYQLKETAFSDIERWVAERKRLLERQFDRLEAFLAATGPAEKDGGND